MGIPTEAMIKTKLQSVLKNLAAILILFIVVTFVVFLFRHLRPTGGMLYAGDFRNGFELYVEEACTFSSVGENQPKRESPHSMWRVSDEKLKETVYDICRKIETYCEYDDAIHSFFGNPDWEYYPRIYLITDSVCYRIEIVNWNNYPNGTVPDLEKMYGKPLLRVYRIDLSLKPESDSLYDFVKNYFGPDTMNRENKWGWYSTLSQKGQDQLLKLVQSVGAGNAENIFLFE